MATTNTDNTWRTLAFTVHPSYALLSTKIHWNEVQTRADGAFVVTNKVNRAGFAIGKEFLLGNETFVVHGASLQVPSASATAIQLWNPATIQDAIAEFASMAWSDEAEFGIVSVGPEFLNMANTLVAEQGGVAWTHDQLVSVLNHNLCVLRRANSPLPPPSCVSLEACYGRVLSQFREQALQECPLLGKLMLCTPLLWHVPQPQHVTDEPPSQHKTDSLLKDILQGSWATVVTWPTELNVDQLCALLEQGSKLVGASRRRKMRGCIRALTKRRDVKDRIWRVHGTTLSLGQTVDYRTLPSQCEVLQEMLAVALRRCKTDICIANMATARNPRLHPLFTPIMTMCSSRGAMDMHSAVERKCSALRDGLHEAADCIKELRAIGHWTSDWQNAVARRWTQLRQAHTTVQSVAQRHQVQTPQWLPAGVPPVQYYLALDLYPQANAFAFTYGRQQGYALTTGYSDSVQWYCEQWGCNDSEVLFFCIALLAPPAWLRDACAGLPAEVLQAARAGNRRALVQSLDAWLEGAGANSGLAVETRAFVQQIFNELPQWLQTKATGNVKAVSAIAAHMYVLDTLAQRCVLEQVDLDPSVLDVEARRRLVGRQQETDDDAMKI
eukprot:TRINITY_DN10075_c0_g1_i1.p1 TRINITY_DN10075_c0_g1~~TRINITY_DN10075_c0_g1_i1.p1  ORF type:complete len:639 (-),score=140.98 TRINITY_DN10075_c0_g1_i1:25-1857(-)